MSDIAKKYQHYFNESIKLQKLAEEQQAYIAELEEALAALSEDLTTDEREDELNKAVDKAEEKAYRYLSPDNPKGMWNRKTGRPKSGRHLARGTKLEGEEQAARDRRDDEMNDPKKIYGKGGKVVGTTGGKKKMFKLGTVQNPDYKDPFGG